MALQGGNGPHDVGGRVDLLGIPLQQDEEDSGWGTECHALFVALTKKSILSTDELRRGVEGLSEEAHATWGYYARWIAAITGLLQEKDVISPGSLEAQLAGDAVERRDPRFVEGNCVRVRSESSARTTWRRPHVRTPAYLHGATGIVESVVGRFQDPSMLAYGIRNMPEQHLYRVRFKQGDVWPNAEMSDDTIDVEVYDHWLVEDGAAAPPPATTIQHQATHGGEHAHAHAHASRGMTEAEAVRREGPPHPGEWLYRAVVALLISQGIVAQDEIVRYAQALECAGQALPAARLVARAWCDDGFRCRLLSDATSAAREMGIDASNPNAPTVLRVMENEAHVHNLIVCTLCRCVSVPTPMI